jgi:hypothetical protein
MAPNCDGMDGPVVKAAEMALEMENVNFILPYISPDDEGELKYAFERTVELRELSADAAELADYWFFETAVRLHLKWRGNPYTGIKPAGINVGPALSLAEDALAKEDLKDLMSFMISFVREDIQDRFEDVLSKKDHELNDVEDARDYVNSMLDFVRYLQQLYEFMEKG